MKRVKRVALIGFGASGLFCLKGLAGVPGLEVHVYDVGPPYADRYACPISLGALKMCPPKACNYCAPGQSAGSWNDLKVIIEASEVIGGRLWDLVGERELQRLLDEVRDTIIAHSPDEIPIVRPNADDLAWINAEAAAAGMVYYPQVLLHCGSDRAQAINTGILDSIVRSGNNIVFHWNRRVLRLWRHDSKDSKFRVSCEKYRNKAPTDQPEEAEFDIVVVSVGRGGAVWLTEQEFYPDLVIQPGQVDLGFRVETRGEVTAEMDRRLYEPKLYKRTSSGVWARHFCSNPLGYVTPEQHEHHASEHDDPYALVNGHAKRDEKSEMSNFAILVRLSFPPPFKNPQHYSRELAKRVNQAAGGVARGGVLVQRFGDFRAKRPTASLEGNWVRPTLQTACGDLTACYPEQVVQGAIEYLEALDKICPGIAHGDTLFYGPEAKSYPDWITVTRNMEALDNLYIIGDASSHTRGLGQSFCSGMLAGEGIRRKLASS
jgi:uncharacterized FAD-dependent dehydrogenase